MEWYTAPVHKTDPKNVYTKNLSLQIHSLFVFGTDVWNSVLIEFTPQGARISADGYSETLKNQHAVQNRICQASSFKICKLIIIFYHPLFTLRRQPRFKLCKTNESGGEC